MVEATGTRETPGPRRLVWVGVLTPLAGRATAPIRLDRDVVVLGPARVCRASDDFVIEDPGGTTFVDGVPVLSCLLHDGDLVQVGPSLFRFERALEERS